MGRHSLCGSSGAGSERGREPPLALPPPREEPREKAVDSGRSEGGRNERVRKRRGLRGEGGMAYGSIC